MSWDLKQINNNQKGEVMNEQIVVEPISTEVAVRAQQEAPAMLKQAEAIVILTQAHYESANDVMKAVKTKYKELDTKRKEITKPLDQAKNAVMDLFRNPLELLKKAEISIKVTMIAYAEHQEKIRQEEQKKIDAKAKIEEEKERKRLEKRAEKWAAKGKTAKAEELQEQAEEVEVVAPVVAPKVEKVAGVSFKQNWSAIVIDETKVPREYMQVNTMALNRIAKATKGAIKIPGVEFKMEKILASRG